MISKLKDRNLIRGLAWVRCILSLSLALFSPFPGGFAEETSALQGSAFELSISESVLPMPVRPLAKKSVRKIIAICGDGMREGREECDDGNVLVGDGCSPICQLESRCGNKVPNTGEQCDDGNTFSGDGCSSTCTLEPGFPTSSFSIACNVNVSGGGTIFVGETTTVSAQTNCATAGGEREREDFLEAFFIRGLLPVTQVWAFTLTESSDSYAIVDGSNSGSPSSGSTQDLLAYYTKEGYEWSVSGDAAEFTGDSGKDVTVLCLKPGDVAVLATGLLTGGAGSAPVICVPKPKPACGDGTPEGDKLCDDGKDKDKKDKDQKECKPGKRVKVDLAVTGTVGDCGYRCEGTFWAITCGDLQEPVPNSLDTSDPEGTPGDTFPVFSDNGQSYSCKCDGTGDPRNGAEEPLSDVACPRSPLADVSCKDKFPYS